MAERKRKGKTQTTQETPDGPTKLEKDVANYLFNKCPKKQTLFLTDKVYYFIGTKAVDALEESKWAKSTKKEDALLKDREACVDFISGLMDRGMFVRAQKIVVGKKTEGKKDKKPDEKKKDDKKAAKDKDTKTEETVQKEEKSKDRKMKEDEDKSESSEEEKGTSKEKKDREKKKKKIKLEPFSPDKQIFLDSNDAYVWTYEPTSIRNIVAGLLLVIGAIGLCLFPLWPPIVRQGVYYLSLVGVGLLGLLITVSLLRYVVFAFVWLATGGNIHFWYLPNLTEDCGFFESFVPVYTISNKKQREEKEKEKAAKKAAKKKAKKDGKEDEQQVSPKPKRSTAVSSAVELSDEKRAAIEPTDEPSKTEPGKENQNSDDDFEVIASSQSEVSENGNDAITETQKSTIKRKNIRRE